MNYAKLPPEDKRLWVEALRSGDYKQGTGSLFLRGTDHGGSILSGETREGRAQHCCIGVFAEVKKLLTPSHVAIHGTGTGPACDHLFASGEYAGWDGFAARQVLQRKLVVMNDDEKKSFAEIADWIEENL